VTVVPAETPADTVLALRPDGVFLSNGPGDPEPCTYAIDAIRKIIAAGIPVFGICLGHQLLGLASGASTVKMKFGHHGANHPVQDLDTKQVLITRAQRNPARGWLAPHRRHRQCLRRRFGARRARD
jgi:carbamoyl-phosphate synthase small subunit